MSLLKKFAVTGFMSLLMIVIGGSSLPAQVHAAADTCNKSSAFLGLPTWYSYLELGEEYAIGTDGKPVLVDGNKVVIDKCAILGPAGTDGGLNLAAVVPLVGLAVLEIMLRLAGLAGFIFVVYGGFKYITSQGEPDKTKQSRQTITNALIGIVISIIAAAAVSFIANTLTTKG